MSVDLTENFFELADEADKAAVTETRFQLGALQEAQRRAAPEVHPDFDGKHCVECGETIPKARLALIKIRCIDCQTVKERNQRLYAN